LGGEKDYQRGRLLLPFVKGGGEGFKKAIFYVIVMAVWPPPKHENPVSFPSPLMGEGAGEGDSIAPLTSILSLGGERRYFVSYFLSNLKPEIAGK